MERVKLFEQPRIYYIFGLFILLFLVLSELTKEEMLATSWKFLLTIYVISLTIYLTFKSKLRINTISGNTPKAVGIAFIMIMILMAFSTIVGIILGYAHTVMEANSIAMLGSLPKFIFLNFKFLSFLIIVGFIAPLETITLVQVGDVILNYSRSTYRLNDIKVWITAIMLGIGAMFYHAYSKFIELTGQLNIHALFIVFFLFSSSFILAVKTKEMESPIYYHMGNNAIAVWYLIKGAFGF